MIAASNRARAFATPIVLATPAVLAPAVDDPAQHRVDLGLQLVLEFLVAVLLGDLDGERDDSDAAPHGFGAVYLG